MNSPVNQNAQRSESAAKNVVVIVEKEDINESSREMLQGNNAIEVAPANKNKSSTTSDP